MAQASPIEFPPFHLDVVNEQLWRGPEQIHLRPKTFAALRYLVEHSEQLVTKEALFQVLWPGTYVSDSVLMVCIRELRKALGDEARAPRFIETVHGRGYRFIAEVVSSQHSVVRSPSSHPNAKLQPPAPSFVGREAELRQLHRWLGKALDGERQTVFVTGEPGIGKTTIVEAFLSQLAIEDKIWIGRGQCIEHYGAGEAYMPVLEALGRLSRASEGEHLIDVLNRYAPTWLVQLPALLNTADFEQLQRKVQGTRANGCCAKWLKQSKPSQPSGRLSSASKICTGAMCLRWSYCRSWRGGKSLLGSSCSAPTDR
jgi:DNA-binding winged helix-turn-helix (wHTH) protein